MTEDFTGQIAANMKARRKELGMTLDEVAKKAGTVKSYVWDLENGQAARTSVATLVNVASALNTSAGKLVGFSLDKVRRADTLGAGKSDKRKPDV